MAAVQQQPGPEGSRAHNAFIESMEEEIRRVAEHLERRSSTRRPHDLTRGRTFSSDPDRGGGPEAGFRRRATMGHQPPRHFATIGSHYGARDSTPPPRSPGRPSPPRSAPADGKSAPLPTVFPEFVGGDLQNGAFGEDEVYPQPKDRSPPPTQTKTRSLRAYSHRRTPDPSFARRTPDPSSARRTPEHSFVHRTPDPSSPVHHTPDPTSPSRHTPSSPARHTSDPSSPSRPTPDRSLGSVPQSMPVRPQSMPTRTRSQSAVDQEQPPIRTSSVVESGRGRRTHTSTITIRSSRAASVSNVGPSQTGTGLQDGRVQSPFSSSGSGSRESSSTPLHSSRETSESPASPPPKSSSSGGEYMTPRESSASRESSTAPDEPDTPEVKSVSLVRGRAPRRHTAAEDHEDKPRPPSEKLVEETRGRLGEVVGQLGQVRQQHERALREKEEQLRKVGKENGRLEREKWELLRRARDAAERSLHLRTQLDMKESSLRAAHAELERARDELISVKSANTSLRALLSDLRAPRSSVDVGVQVELGVPLRRNPSIEIALDQGLAAEEDGEGGGFDRASQARTSSSTLGEVWPEHFERAPSVSSISELSRDATPTLLSGPSGERRSKRKKIPIFGRMRRSSGKRGSVNSIDGLDLSHSSIIHGARGPTPISFPYSAVSTEMLAQWRLVEEFHEVPFVQWNVRVIAAWMEAGLGMGQYVGAVKDKVPSGQVMMAMSEGDLEKKLGIGNLLHRRKLRLAIADQNAPHMCQYPLLGKMDYGWVAFEWVVDIGLPHLAEPLKVHLVDGHLLNSLSKEDLKKHLHVSKKSEQLSFLSGVELLRMHDFDREAIQEHRRSAQNPLYWTNRNVCDWLKDIGLNDYAGAAAGSGVHGALLFLERGHFTSEHLANLLHISHGKSQPRKLLAEKLAALFSEDLSDSVAPTLPPRSPSRHSITPTRLPSTPTPEPVHPALLNGLSQPLPVSNMTGFYRTASNPLIHQPHNLPERARHSLRDFALRSTFNRQNPALARSATPTVLSSTTV